MFWKRKKSTEERIVVAIRVLLWLLPLVLLAHLLDKYFVPSGTETIVYAVQKGSPLVRNFASKEPDRLIGTKNTPGATDYFQQITTSPLYFDVIVPRPFRQATVTVKYQNPKNQPSIQLGVMQANKAYSYKTLADLNIKLNSLPDYWELVRDGDVYLWQKNVPYYQEIQARQALFNSRKKKLDAWRTSELDGANGIDQQQVIEQKYLIELDNITTETKVVKTGAVTYSSVQDFLRKVPPKNEIVQFQYDMNKYFELPGYQRSTTATEITKSMRGAQEIYTYLADHEDLQFVLSIQDINRHVGADPVNITVFNPSGKKVLQVAEPDDGETAASGRVRPERQINVHAAVTQHGVYRLVIDTNDDIFIKKIRTFQHLLMFKGHVYLTDNQEYQAVLGDMRFSPTVVYTDNSVIRASTSHQKSLQTLAVGVQNLTLNTVGTQEEKDGLHGVTTIVSPKNDVYIEGDGFFAFSRDQLFDPTQVIVPSLDSVSNADDFDYIIAHYQQAQTDGDWLVASTTVAVPQLYFDRESDLSVHFIINMPGLHESGKILKVKDITIQFQKDPITVKKIVSKLDSWIKHVFVKL